MSEPKRPEIGASSIARIAGNILSGSMASYSSAAGVWPPGDDPLLTGLADRALFLARYIARKAQEPEGEK